MRCTVAGCVSETYVRGLCQAHNRRVKVHGDVLASKPIRQRGGGYKDTRGYRHITKDGKRKPEHVWVAESVLGGPLPPGAVVHHIDENPSNNDPSNLVICPSREYHALIHQRMRALAACGHADWRPCCRCGQHDDPVNLSFSGNQPYHAKCNRDHAKRMKEKR